MNRDTYSDPRRGNRRPEYSTQDTAANYSAERYRASARRSTSPQRRSTSSGARPQSGQRPTYEQHRASQDASIYARNNYRGSASRSRTGSAGYSQPQRAQAPRQPKRRGKPTLLVALAVIVALVGTGLWYFNREFTVTVNGTKAQVKQGTTLQQLIDMKLASPQPGDLVAVDGSELKSGEGDPFYAEIDGEGTADPKRTVGPDSTIAIRNGANLTEDYTEEEKTVPAKFVETESWGAIHLLKGEESNGIDLMRTGTMSGKTVTAETIKPVEDRVYDKFNIDTGGDKVIALTFDDGPWPDSTAQVLDVLSANNAKATFFTVGTCIEDGDGAALVKRMDDAGHQVCTHSYDHARGSGGSTNMSKMSQDEQIQEVVKGQEAISNATGKPASKVFRSPGGNFPIETVQLVSPYITAEIGWNIDTTDWKKPGVAAIVDQLMQVKPGNVVLMHDGGGNRTQTVAALKKALPTLSAKGYRFVTIDELLTYA